MVLIVFLATHVAQSQSVISPVFTFDTKSPVANLLSPNGGQAVNNTAPLTVTWTATDDNLKPNPIAIQLITQPGNNIYTLAQNIANTGSATVNLPAIMTTQAKIKVVAKDMFGNEGVDESSGFFTIGSNNLTAGFVVSATIADIGVPIDFTDQSSGSPLPNSWSWNFGDGTPPSNEQNPDHTYNDAGSYSVTLTVNNGNAQNQKTISNYIHVNALNYGIDLQIVETGGTNVIKWVGYQYKNAAGVLVPGSYFPVENNMAHILWDNKFFWENYNNYQIRLYSEVNGQKKQVGHIRFEYDHDIEKKFKRNAVLFFHNDGSMTPDFPYRTSSPIYDWRWEYYEIGEYPVSMLIPPDNSFPATFDKQPLLFIHGWGGTYSLKKNPDAVVGDNEVSYWFTTVGKVNQYGNFQAWQYYYPYDTDIPTLGKCLKAGIGHLKSKYATYKIGIITHSMGGLVTSEYLTTNPTDAQNKLLKVLYSAPPIHGSIGANKHYKTNLGNIVELNDGQQDRNAPAPRDMALGSEFMWNLHNKAWVDLNSANGLKDDYFVLLGTTKNLFGIGAALHQESSNHNDGIVSISSASLTEKGIGFASFHGNHDDGVHAQSKIRNDLSEQNIGNSNLIPEIVFKYFSLGYDDFLTYLTNKTGIEAVVSNTRQIKKPVGQTWENLSTYPNVNYKKGILNFRFFPSSPFSLNMPDQLFAYYNENTHSIHASRLPQILGGIIPIGAFVRNKNVTSYPSYFFSSFPLLLDGCAINFSQGINYLTIDDFASPIIKNYPVTLNYSQSTLISFGTSSKSALDIYRDQSDQKTDSVLSVTGNPVEDLLSVFHINPEDTVVKFVCYLADPNPTGIQVKVKSPVGTIYDSASAGVTYHFNHDLGEYTISIQNPTIGKWHVWMESNTSVAPPATYNAVAYMQSDLHAFASDTNEIAAVNDNYQLAVGLQMGNQSLSDSLVVMATIFKPDGTNQVFNISASPVQNDNSLIFGLPYQVDSAGYYTVKYNLDGVYNGFRFERAIYQQFEASDTIPFMNIADVELDFTTTSTELNLKNYTYNLEGYDTLFYSAEIIATNIDTNSFSWSFDSTYTKVYMAANLSDTGTVVMKFTCHYGGQTIRDTMTIAIMLPELSVANPSLSDTTINSGASVNLNYQLRNTGNRYSGGYEVRYYLSQDTLLQISDPCIGSKTIMHQEPDSIIAVADTVEIPLTNLVGGFYLLIEADAGKRIIELNENNNIARLHVFVNGAASHPVIIEAAPGDSAVHLRWFLNEPANLAGYIIYYDTDSISPFNGIHSLTGQNSPIMLQGTDTSFTVSGLFNDTTYYFSVSAYNIFGLESQPSGFASAMPHSNIPENTILQGINVATGQNNCYQALQTITVAGSGTDFMVQNGGIANLVAGMNIKILPVSKVYPGGYLHARIALNNQYCSSMKNDLVESKENDDPDASPASDPKNTFFKVYPNPTEGRFVVEFKKELESSRFKVQGSRFQVRVYNLFGVEALEEQIITTRISEFSLQNQPPGIYIIRVFNGNQSGTSKIIKL